MKHFYFAKRTSGTLGLGVTRWLKGHACVYLCVCVHVMCQFWPLLVSELRCVLCLQRCLICCLTIFIFSHCGLNLDFWNISLTQMGDKAPRVPWESAESLITQESKSKMLMLKWHLNLYSSFHIFWKFFLWKEKIIFLFYETKTILHWWVCGFIAM